MPDYVTHAVSALPREVPLGRYLEALALSRGDSLHAREYAGRWSDSPHVAAAFAVHTKAATAPGTTTDGAWAGPLVQVGLAADGIALLRGSSILGALESRLRAVPFGVKVPRDVSPTALGGWIAESGPTPVGKLAFDTAGPLPATKCATIVVVTKDVLTVSSPTSQVMITRGVVGALGAKLDASFLDPALAVSPSNPASVTNTGVAITTTGSTSAAIQTDLAAMRAAVTTNGPRVWIMKPATAGTLAATLPAGTHDLNSDTPKLHGSAVIISANALGQITLLDPSAILLATDSNAIELDLSQNASVQMNDAPDNPATAATVPTSFFQSNLVGVRAARYVHWLKVHTAAVSYMVVGY